MWLPCEKKKPMKNTYCRNKTAITYTVIAVAEGIWNGIVISGVLALSALLIKGSAIFYFAH